MKRKPKFDTAQLKSFLEERLGRGLRRFEMITDCSRPQNFLCETSDGERLAVKCVPPEKTTIKYFEHFLVHLQELKGSRAIEIAGGPWMFGDCKVVAMKWAYGVRVMPNDLTAAQEAELVKAYGEFSDAMQRTTLTIPPRDNEAVRRHVEGHLSGWGCGFLRRFLAEELTPEAMAYDKSRLKVIHGDFHHGNFYFDGDRITGFMDLEDFRWGYPADDWMRYVVCAAEHLHWYDFAGRRKLLALFGRLLPLAPADEWRESVAGLLIRKLDRRFAIKKKGPKAWLALNMRFRIGFYRSLFDMIREYENAGGGAAK